jgi:hypothetical protein
MCCFISDSNKSYRDGQATGNVIILNIDKIALPERHAYLGKI